MMSGGQFVMMMVREPTIAKRAAGEQRDAASNELDH